MWRAAPMWPGIRLPLITREGSVPGLMEPVREEDREGAVCYRVSPELYLGYERGAYGNTQLTPDRPATYRDPGMHMDGHAYIEGDWLISGEYLARPAGAGAMSRLTVPYMAKEVNLVMHPPSYGGAAVISVQQDGAPLRLGLQVDDGGARLEGLLSRLRARGFGSLHFRKVHPTEVSKDSLEALGFRAADECLRYVGTARSD